MARVSKDPNSPYWTAVYLNQQDEWQFKTTNRKRKSKALGLAVKWERAAQLDRDKVHAENISREILGKLTEATAPRARV